MKKTRNWHARLVTRRNIILMAATAAVVAVVLIANHDENVLAGRSTGYRPAP